MSDNKRPKIQLRSDLKIKRSFDERVCDDLCEELLQYLPIEAKLKLECVSKQFQRNVFCRQQRLVICGHDSKARDLDSLKIFVKITKPKPKTIRLTDSDADDETTAIDCHQLSTVLRKCQNITDLVLGQKFSDVSIENIDEVFETIADRCPRLQRLGLRRDSNHLNSVTIESFADRFGQQMRGVEFPEKYNILYRFCRHLVKSCPNLLSLSGIRFKHLIENNEIVAKNVIKFENLSVDHSLKNSYELFVRHFATKLKYLSIDFISYQMHEEFELIQSLSAFKALKTLKVSSRLYSPNDSSEHLVTCVQSIADNCLYLRHFELRLHSRDLLSEEFSKCFIKFKTLRHFSLSFFDENYSQFSLESLKNCKQLTHLRLETDRLSDEFFDDCETYVPNLIDLELSKVCDLKDRHFLAIAGLKKLKHLTIFCKDFFDLLVTTDGINFLLNYCTELLRLHIFASRTSFSMKPDIKLIDNSRDVELIIE